MEARAWFGILLQRNATHCTVIDVHGAAAAAAPPTANMLVQICGGGKGEKKPMFAQYFFMFFDSISFCVTERKHYEVFFTFYFKSNE